MSHQQKTSSITCMIQDHPAGTYPIKADIKGKGLSNKNIIFTYDLVVSNISPVQSGFGGGRLLTVTGRGFGPETSVTICGVLCLIQGNTSDSTLQCLSPRYNNYTLSLTDQNCNVTISQNDQQVTRNNEYSYLQSMTSTITGVSPHRGGTGGGVLLTIIGERFLSDIKNTDVIIAGIPCDIRSVNTTAVVCITRPSPKTVMNVDVIVNFKNQGYAVPVNAKFSYIDVWSSLYSWGGVSLPKAGKYFQLSSLLKNLLNLCY